MVINVFTCIYTTYFIFNISTGTSMYLENIAVNYFEIILM